MIELSPPEPQKTSGGRGDINRKVKEEGNNLISSNYMPTKRACASQGINLHSRTKTQIYPSKRLITGQWFLCFVSFFLIVPKLLLCICLLQHITQITCTLAAHIPASCPPPHHLI